MAYEWKKYPDSKPDKPGYYYTLYYNESVANHLFKCIWWDGDLWCAWRLGVMSDSDVKGFVPDTRNPYYVPCVQNACDQVQDVDLDLFPFLKRDSDHDTKATLEDL